MYIKLYRTAIFATIIERIMPILMKKLTRSEAINIANNYLETELPKFDWYQSVEPAISAILMFGSTGRGENRPDSDIDILIFVPLEIEEEFTTGEYMYEYEGREINIVLRSIERLRKLADGPCNQFETNVFAGTEILEDDTGEVTRLIELMRTACAGDT